MTPHDVFWMVVIACCCVTICIGTLTTLHRIEVSLKILEFLRRHGPMDSFNLGQVHKISPWTLYPVLRRLVRSSYATSWDVPDESGNRGGRPRRYYKITDTGRALLAAEKGRHR